MNLTKQDKLALRLSRTYREGAWWVCELSTTCVGIGHTLVAAEEMMLEKVRHLLKKIKK